MTDDRYDAWRAARRAPEPAPDFDDRVLASIDRSESTAVWDRAPVRVGLGALGGLALAFRLAELLLVFTP